MDVPEHYRQQYSNSNKQSLTNSNSTVQFQEIVSSLADVIPDDDYMPFYASKYKQLGSKYFVELANKARAGKNPKRLFFWMLKNYKLVK